MTTKFQFKVEMKFGQDQRIVDADSFSAEGDWLVFFRNPARGGKEEYWRTRLDCVVSMETKRMES